MAAVSNEFKMAAVSRTSTFLSIMRPVYSFWEFEFKVHLHYSIIIRFIKVYLILIIVTSKSSMATYASFDKYFCSDTTANVLNTLYNQISCIKFSKVNIYTSRLFLHVLCDSFERVFLLNK